MRPYVRHWVHVAMVGYQGEKMSKSLGNLVFVRDLLDRVPAAVIRLLLCAHHHRSGVGVRRGRARARASARWLSLPSGAEQRRRKFTATDAQAVYDDFMACIDDDLDTPGALAILDEVAGRPPSRAPAAAPTSAAAQLMGPLLDVDRGAASPAAREGRTH